MYLKGKERGREEGEREIGNCIYALNEMGEGLQLGFRNAKSF